MFSKPSKPAQRTATKPVAAEPAPAPAARKPQVVASVIGRDITIEGEVTGEGELHLDGVIRGDVKVGRLSVGETGHIEGSVSAELVEVRGKVIGAITAKQIRLYASSQVDGDITHEQLAMETGASFQGRSLRFQRAAQAREPTPSSSGDVITLGAVSNS